MLKLVSIITRSYYQRALRNPFDEALYEGFAKLSTAISQQQEKS